MPEVKELSPGVFAMTGLYHPDRPEGVNAGFIITTGSIIFIDAGMSIASANALWNEAQSRTYGAKDVYLILTHHHPDHTFGMQYFINQGAHVIAHRELSQLFRHEGDKYRDFIFEKLFHDIGAARNELGDVELTPPRTSITQDEVMIVDGEEVHLLHAPGHVIGQLCVYLPDSRVLFASDAAISAAPPDTQYSRPGGWKMWIDQLQRIQDMPIDIVVPGHGEIGDVELLDDNIIYLRLALGRQNRQLFHVLKHKRFGKALDLSLRNGRTSLFLARHGFIVTALDPREDAGQNWLGDIERENLKARFRHTQPHDYQFDDRFDIMVAANIFHECSTDENLALIDRMREYTQPQGIHLISAFTSEITSRGVTSLFDADTLLNKYSDWEILHSNEGQTPIHSDEADPEPHRHSVMVLAARRP